MKNKAIGLEQKKRQKYARKNKAREQKAKRIEKRHALISRVRKTLSNRPSGFGYNNCGAVSRVELIVHGDMSEVASRLAGAGISLSDIKKTGGNIAFKIQKKDLGKAVAILSDMCYNFKVGESYGVPKLGAFMLSRMGLAVGTAVASAFLFLAYSHIWHIDIYGNDTLTSAAIERVLSEAGIVPGTKKKNVSLDDVAAALNSLEGIADASAEIAGTSLRVYVLEAENPGQRQTFSHYASLYDATVTRIVMRSGTALVKRGDVVKAGDILADGKVFSTAGELLYVASCDCDVYGDVSISFSADIGSTYIEYERTGRHERTVGYELFGHSFGARDSAFASYESRVSTANYDVLIPLYVTVCDRYETRPVEKERDIDSAVREYLAYKLDELEFTDGGFKTSYTVKPLSSGLYTVHFFISGEAKISSGISKSD